MRASVLALLVLCSHSTPIPELESLDFDEITTENGRDIGWIKAISCDEQLGASPFTYHADVTTISPYAISLKFVPAGGTNNSDYDSYAVTAKQCSNPVLALNNNKEVSYSMDPYQKYIDGFSSLEDWTGSQVAKNRLSNTCYGGGLQQGGYANDITDSVYQAACNADGIHIVQKEGWCVWDWDATFGHNIDIYFGYDANKTYHCDSPVANTAPLNYKHHEATNISDKLNHIEFDESTTVNGVDIGWIKLMSCNEHEAVGEKSEFTLRDGYSLDDIEDLLPYVISMRISPPGNRTTNANYDDFVVETIPCSNPVFAISNKKEMTWYLNEFTHRYTIEEYKTNLRDNSVYWMGSDVAKDRLRTDDDCRFYLENGEPRDFPTIYHSCDYSMKIDMNKERCFWSTSSLFGQDIEIYFGFDKHKENSCTFELEEVNVTYSDNFIFVPYRLNGLDAELFCEHNFNTTLAIMNTSERIMEAVELRYSAGYADEGAWIGLYSPNTLDWRHWQWYGVNQSCDVGECSFDTEVNETYTSWERHIRGWASFVLETKWYGCGYLRSSSHDSTVFPSNAFSTPFFGCVLDNYEERLPIALPLLCDRFNHLSEDTHTHESCSFSHHEPINISKAGFEASNEFTIASEMRISFDIKIDPLFICTAKRCNIFHIGDQVATKVPSMYIVNDDIQIYMFNGHASHIDLFKHTIPNGLRLLRDGAYHRVDLYISYQMRKYMIDGTTYVWTTGQETELNEFKYNQYIGKIYQLFISNPWEDSVNGTIANLCIQTSHEPGIIQWQRVEHITDRDVYFDTTSRKFTEYSLPIAYYNEQLIIVTAYNIYHRFLSEALLSAMATDRSSVTTASRVYDMYTNNTNGMRPLNDTFMWPASFERYMDPKIDIAPPLIMHSQQFIQDGDTLYVLLENNTDPNGFDFEPTFAEFQSTYMPNTSFYTTMPGLDDDDDEHDVMDTNSQIYVFNLMDLRLENTIIIPKQYHYRQFAFDSCLTTNHSHLFIFNEGILVYDIDHGTFTDSSVDLSLIMTGCATTVTNDKILIFGGLNTSDYTAFTMMDTVYEYNITNDSIQLLPNVTLKHPTYAIRAIAAGNNKMYLYGGITNEEGETDQIRSIFNVQSGAFETYQHIDDRKGYFSTAIYDEDNHLLLRYLSAKHQIDLLVLDAVSIDLTISNISMWRSDVWLEYIINDYTVKSDSLYKLQLDYSNSTGDITKFMMIDVQRGIGVNDVCYLCDTELDDPRWNDDCAGGSEGCHIPIHDTSIHSITIDVTSINYNVQILYSDSLYVAFHKCDIRYEITPRTIKANEPIFVNPHVDALCYSNPLMKNGYIAHMFSSQANIDHDIIINASDCRICDLEYGNYTQCSPCTGGSGIIPSIDDELEEGGAFMINISSKATDLVVSPSTIQIAVGTASNELSEEQIWVFAIICAVVCVLIAFAGYLYWQRRKAKLAKAEKEQHKHDIFNPYVVVIGIGSYDSNIPIPNRADGLQYVGCPDLFGIKHDYLNLNTLCQILNYDIAPMEDRASIEWTQQQIMDLLRESAAKVNASLATDTPYDCLLVICSGHGLDRQIITSDYQAITKPAIHRLFSANYPALREIPRVFLFDVCDGGEERSWMPSTYTEDDESVILEDNETEQDKGIDDGAGNSKMTGKRKGIITEEDVIEQQNRDLWSADHQNPDYKLVTIHAANLRFKAKLDSRFGSLLIKTFVDKLNANFHDKTELFFGEIMDNVEQELHKKQQTVATFNNHTRFLRFQKGKEKKREAKKLDDEEQYKQDISNPLVLIIGVNVDYFKMMKLCQLLNYDFYPQQATLQWKQQEIMDFLTESAQKANDSLSTLDPYDSILVVCTGHALSNNMITSMHRIFGVNHPDLTDLPRIFMFDCCKTNDGDITEQGKNISSHDILVKTNTENWKQDQPNPDYKLVTIQSANFEECSYLIDSFVTKMSENVLDSEQNFFFGDMMDNIQKDLHSKGKQQSVNTYNNHTRYVRFQKRNKVVIEDPTQGNDDVDIEHSANDVEMVPLIRSLMNDTFDT